MKKSLFIFSLILILLAMQSASSNKITSPTEFTIHYFYAQGCIHCANVAKDGILDRIGNISGVEIIKHDVAVEPSLFFKYADIFHLANDKVTRTPILFLIHENKIAYLAGDTPIINELEGKISNFNGIDIPQENQKHTLTLGAIIIASLIDSINPCAFGVLIFLLVCLLNMGSAKRALRYGLLYCFVVFLTYFLAGLGLFRVIQSLTGIIYYVHLAIGLLSVCLGIIQFIDIIFPGKFISLRIPQSAKPLIEKLSEKTTLPAVMLLGFLASLFELPCTGGVYIAILAAMSINKTFAIGYLLLYNIIFILPLIAITLLIYKGTKPELLQKWTSEEKIWMKLASGLVMLGLGIYLFLNL